MKFFASPVQAPAPRTTYSGYVATTLAGVMTLFLVMQLFTFDEFIELASTFQLPGVSGSMFASMIIVLELLALPFLLRMALSRAFRWVSVASLVGAMILWMYSTVFVVTQRSVESVGFSGGLGELTPGWWAVLIVVVLWVMSVWSIWGLMPRRNAA